ncbi:MAG: DUF1552 domain-containing protein [Planctomycetales bacterium]
MRKSWSLKRRTFLQGAGVTLALPLLNSMSEAAPGSKSASEGGTPKRMACMFFPNGVSLPPANHDHHKTWHWFPHGEGKEFQFTQTLESLEPLRDRLSILGGLSHPSGRNLPGHSVSDVFLTGSKIGKNTFTNSISVDQVYAQHAGIHTRLHSLQLSTTGGIGQSGRTNTLSFTRDGQPIYAEDDLRRAFNRMFGNDAASDAAARRAVARRKSMLDAVLENAKSLNHKLGGDDRKKLEEYLSSVRETERRVERTEQWLDVPKARVAPDSLNLEANRDAPLDYIRAMYDLMFLAFQTDSTRAATYLIGTEGGGQLSDVFPNALGLGTHHQLSHSTNKSDDGYKNWALWDQFLAQQLAYFLQKLKNASEGEGNLLDRTVVFHGCSTSTTHRSRNYPIVLAGGGELGVKHGRFHQFDENQHRLADLFVTMLNSLGVETERFADNTTNLNQFLLS